MRGWISALASFATMTLIFTVGILALVALICAIGGWWTLERYATILQYAGMIGFAGGAVGAVGGSGEASQFHQYGNLSSRSHDEKVAFMKRELLRRDRQGLMLVVASVIAMGVGVLIIS